MTYEHAAQVLSITFNFHPCECIIRVRGQFFESCFLTPQPTAHFLYTNRCLVPGMVLLKMQQLRETCMLALGVKLLRGPFLT